MWTSCSGFVRVGCPVTAPSRLAGVGGGGRWYSPTLYGIHTLCSSVCRCAPDRPSTSTRTGVGTCLSSWGRTTTWFAIRSLPFRIFGAIPACTGVLFSRQDTLQGRFRREGDNCSLEFILNTSILDTFQLERSLFTFISRLFLRMTSMTNGPYDSCLSKIE